MMMAGWIIGVTMQIIAGAIARMRRLSVARALHRR